MMDLLLILFISCISFLIGIIVTLVVQYYLLYSYFKKSPVVKPPQQRQNSIDYSLPEALKRQLEVDSDKTKANLPVSLVLQFLFHELRHSEAIKRWLFKKLSMEFEELLTKTTIGKFFETINIKDMNLGNQFPDIKQISVEEVKLDDKEGHIDLVSLCLDLDYSGNFLLSVDAKMKFGKTAYLSIKVKKISGKARLQFTRHPYTHWSFSFYTEPELDLAVESHFQGRQLQSNITNLIVNQIKKAIKRKHTLPNYKIRYKPFFGKTDPSQLDLEDSEIVPQGQLDMTCMEISRLELLPDIHTIYCTVSIDTIPWICLYAASEDKINMILEITISKVRQAQLGVIFRQEQGYVVVENVSPHSCASRCGIRAGDVVLAVENRAVSSVPQVAKFIKSIASVNITLRIERLAENYVFKPKASEPKMVFTSSDNEECTELTQTEQDSFVIIDNNKVNEKSKPQVRDRCNNKTPEKMPKLIGGNENMSKLAQTIGNFSLRKRKTSVSSIGGANDNKTPNESARNTPNSSGPGTPQHTFKHHQTLPSATIILSAKKHSISEVPEIRASDSIESTQVLMADNIVQVLKSKEMMACESIISFNDDFQFNLKANMKYLNVNVWGASPHKEKDILLGYANIPLSHILNECCGSVLGHYMRSYSFLPPNLAQPNSQPPHPLTSHSGFEHVFCFGDILLSFVWTHEDDIEVKAKLPTSLSADGDVKQQSDAMGVVSSKHDFIRTQFHRTTHCDFCTKKIWLKDAVQCRECGLCCHKKCIAKCQMSTGCVPGERKSNMSSDEHASCVNQPEITMTEAGEEAEHAATFAENCMKRVNSVNNLSIPGLHMPTTISKSLPPSPQRTPSRKQSIVNLNPFALCPWALDEVQKQSNEASDSVNRLLEQVMLCPQDESLMDVAKETGKQLYANMTHEERVDKINVMMSELKKTLDTVTMEHMELSKQMGIEESEEEKTKLAFLMGQADAKVHGLSVLMLHYCSSLQHTQEKIV